MRNPTNNQSKQPTKTNVIVIEQTVLEPWRYLQVDAKGKVLQLDIYDAALLNHVEVRLSRRAGQRKIMVDDEPAVWVHYPSIRAENWLIDLSNDRISRRFKKLVDMGLLVKKMVPRGTGRGSQTFYGLSKTLRKAREEFDRRGNSIPQDHPAQTPDQTFGTGSATGLYGTGSATDRSLGISLGNDEEGKTSSSSPKKVLKDKSRYIEIVDRVKRLEVIDRRPHENLDFQKHVDDALSKLQDHHELSIDDLESLMLFIARREKEPAHLLAALDPDRLFLEKHFKEWEKERKQQILYNNPVTCPMCGNKTVRGKLLSNRYCIECMWIVDNTPTEEERQIGLEIAQTRGYGCVDRIAALITGGASETLA